MGIMERDIANPGFLSRMPSASAPAPAAQSVLNSVRRDLSCPSLAPLLLESTVCRWPKMVSGMK